MPKEYANQNGKRNSEMKLTGKKALEGTSKKENLQNWSFSGIPEQRHMALRHGEVL
jgi:hypothetical protein